PRSPRHLASARKSAQSTGRWIGYSVIRQSSLLSTDQMLSQFGKTRSALVAGVVVLALFLAGQSFMPGEWRDIVRERAFDAVLAADRRLREPGKETVPVVIVDIDRASLERLGPWPWPRETMARLVEAVASAKP